MDKEKLVRDLVNTFNDRDELHIAYKKIIKEILRLFSIELVHIQLDGKLTLQEFINEFVEERFRPEK